jgi:hypothetical protein
MKTHGGVEVHIHTSLASPPGGGEWIISFPYSFTSRGKKIRFPLDRKLGESKRRSGRGGEEKNTIPGRYQEWNRGRLDRT